MNDIIMKYIGADEYGRPNYAIANKDLSAFFKFKDWNFSSNVYAHDDKIKVEKNMKPFSDKKYAP